MNLVKNTKKVLFIVTIVSFILIILSLIFAIFGLEIFKKGPIEYSFLSLVTICVACFFSIGCLNILQTKKIIAIINLALLLFTMIGGIIIYWTGFDKSIVFNKIIGIIAIATVLFIIVVSTYIKLERNYSILQFITYIVIGIIDIIISICICGKDLLDNKVFEKVFWVLVIIAFGLLCTINILAKRSINSDNEKYIKIKKSEYEYLVNRVKELEKKNKEL